MFDIYLSTALLTELYAKLYSSIILLCEFMIILKYVSSHLLFDVKYITPVYLELVGI